MNYPTQLKWLKHHKSTVIIIILLLLLILTNLPKAGASSINKNTSTLSTSGAKRTPTNIDASSVSLINRGGFSVSKDPFFQALKARDIAHQKAVERARIVAKQRIVVTVAKPVLLHPKPVFTSGCVTNYFTGRYALDQIISHESGGRSCATNAGGCFGLLQACPGYPLREACGGNPACQIAWFIRNKTGGRSWEQIWASWQIRGYW